jgi:Ca-activated chloride channel family protein
MRLVGLAAALFAVLAPSPGASLARAQSSAAAPAGAATAVPATAPASAPLAGDPSPGAPVLESYRFNPRERTSRALAAWEKGRIEDAVAPLDSALRLRPGDPLVEFNAGTAHLGANQPDAAQLLDQAAKHAPPALAADAFYNLGNARLEAKDAQGAIDAYKGALRAQSDLPSAKRNLELALRLLKEQQRQQEQQQKDSEEQQDRQQNGGEGQRQEQEQNREQQPKPNPQQSPDPQQTPPQAGAGTPQEGAGDPQPPKESPLPQFQEQKDMTAEQAAAILQAVENLERQQRREQARAVARAKTSVEKDW